MYRGGGGPFGVAAITGGTIVLDGLFTEAAEDTITAFATGGQTNATALSATKNLHRVSVCATAADSVKLPAALVGQAHFLRNDGAASMQVFGQATETIDGVASATGVPQATGAGVWYVCTTAAKWTRSTGAIGPAAITSGTISGVTISSTLNGLTTAGQTLPIIVGRGRTVGATAAVASVAAFTVGGADASFEISANMLITASTTFSIAIQCSYTDEGNTARTMVLALLPLNGVAATNAGNASGAVPYSTAPQTIRAKSGTVITVLTAGTFTTVTYNVEAVIKQAATT